MVNRILIRLKVVQMLYSYLLTRTTFVVPVTPIGTEATPDSQFAYNAYSTLMALLLRVCRTGVTKGSESKLALSPLLRALASDGNIRQLVTNIPYDRILTPSLVGHLRGSIVDSEVFKHYSRKRKAGNADETAMFVSVLNTIFASDKQLEDAFRSLPDYSGVGLERAYTMATDTLRSFAGASDGIAAARNDLERSLDKAYHLYTVLLQLPVQLTRMQEERLENARVKHLATDAERNPNMRFVNNALVRALAEDADLQSFIEHNGTPWDNDPTLLTPMLNAVLASDEYAAYMDAPETDLANDANLWRKLLRGVIFPSDDLAEMLENSSVFWNDDINEMGTFVLKTIRRAQTSEKIELLPKYKDTEDASFGAELFNDVLKNYDDYRALIDSQVNVGSWDPDRIAYMDVVILLTAIAELINYPIG